MARGRNAVMGVDVAVAESKPGRREIEVEAAKLPRWLSGYGPAATRDVSVAEAKRLAGLGWCCDSVSGEAVRMVASRAVYELTLAKEAS